MSQFLVSVRGHVDKPILILIDIDEKRVIREIVLDADIPDWVPLMKKGITGMAMVEGKLYAATWDRVYIVSTIDWKIQDVITSPLFSDLHSLRIANQDELWVASTNIDSILKVRNGEVVWRWSAWERQELGQKKEWVEQDFRISKKQDTDYHHFHINDFYVFSDVIYATYLGQQSKKRFKWANRIENRIRRKLGMKRSKLKSPYFKGGILRIDRDTGYSEHVSRVFGLHDFAVRDKHFFHLEFETNRLVCFDSESGRTSRIRLKQVNKGLLNRGLHFINNNEILVGYTVQRDFSERLKGAKIGHLTIKPKAVRSVIELGSYPGVYCIVPFE